MIDALSFLKMSAGQRQLPDSLNAFGISGGRKSGLSALFATHPSLDNRIAVLAGSGYPDRK